MRLKIKQRDKQLNDIKNKYKQKIENENKYKQKIESEYKYKLKEQLKELHISHQNIIGLQKQNDTLKKQNDTLKKQNDEYISNKTNIDYILNQIKKAALNKNGDYRKIVKLILDEAKQQNKYHYI